MLAHGLVLSGQVLDCWVDSAVVGGDPYRLGLFDTVGPFASTFSFDLPLNYLDVNYTRPTRIQHLPPAHIPLYQCISRLLQRSVFRLLPERQAEVVSRTAAPLSPCAMYPGRDAG
jgi:hypothetical protein